MATIIFSQDVTDAQKKATYAFFKALRKRESDAVIRKLAPRIDIFARVKTDVGMSEYPLVQAAERGLVETVKVLYPLCKGDDDIIRKAMCHAIKAGEDETLYEMLEAGAKCVDKESITEAMFHAIQIGHEQVIYALAAHDMRMDGIYRGLSLLHALPRDNPGLIHMLLHAGADPNWVDNRGRTPLYEMAYRGLTENMRALMAYGADTSIGIKDTGRDSDGDTLLHPATGNGKLEGVQLLLGAGLNPNIADAGGDVPLHSSNDELLWKELFAAGADINLLTCSNASPRKNETSGMDRKIIEIAHYDEHKVKWILQAIGKGANVHAGLGYCGKLKNAGPGKWVEVLQGDLDRFRGAYARFVETGKPPFNSQQLCRLIAMIPIENPLTPLDYANEVQKIFSHAKWQDKSHARRMLDELHNDNLLSAESAEQIMAATFPPERANAQGRMR